MKKLVCAGLCFLSLVITAACGASPVPYSLSGTDDLSVSVTTYHPSWLPGPTIDGVYNYSGWWNPSSDESIMFTFKSGILSVDKIQIYSGQTTLSHTVERCHLFYTTDLNPTFSSTFLPLSNLVFLNSVDGVITGNEVHMNEAVNELLISFDAVEATAIRIIDHSSPAQFSGSSVFNEVTIDEGFAGPVIPEPMSMILFAMAVSGSILRKVRKL